MAEVALRETIDADLGTPFGFQANREASAMAAFPSRDLPAFLEREVIHRSPPASGSMVPNARRDSGPRPRPTRRPTSAAAPGDEESPTFARGT
jgi:hypothetical protein